ncbi:MAG: hypothetical protein ABS59_03330 [Methylobacterium sp. SCN 67-24]|nr:MAG: hypothetical protein ABS59_03330 [Methylobacterium sp. SCN 67-24]
MGFNAGAAGYSSARAMVEAFAEDEEHHLEAMIRFIIANGLDDELRRHDWAGFARGYNGSGYAKNGYHTKLAAAFAKWRKIPDTPYPPAAPTPVIPPDALPPMPEPPTQAVSIGGLPPAPGAQPAAAPPTLGFWASLIAAFRAFINGEL